jgi:hypothetical protein
MNISDSCLQIMLVSLIVIAMIALYNKDMFTPVMDISAKRTEFGIPVAPTENYQCARYNKGIAFPQSWRG